MSRTRNPSREYNKKTPCTFNVKAFTKLWKQPRKESKQNESSVPYQNTRTT